MDKASANKWLDSAQADLDWTVASLKEQIYYGDCFSAQQATEKALKAFLVANGKPVAKIHDLGALVERCKLIDPEFDSLREMVMPLTDYYLQARYPDLAEFIEFTARKAEDAHEKAKATLVFVKQKLS